VTAMAKMEKFLFDNEFDVEDQDWDKEEVEEAPDPNTLPRYSENEMQAALQQARDESRAEGHAAGMAEAHQEIAAFAAQELVKMSEQIARLASAEANNIDMARLEATGLALSVGRRLAGTLIERHPLEFAEEMIADTLNHMNEALRDSKITIRVKPDLVDALTAHIGSIAERTGFTGQTIILGAEEFATGDCRVEWAHGGAERVMTDIDTWIDDAVARYLAAIEEPPAPALPVDEEKSDNDPTPPPEDDGIKQTGGSKTVRYDDDAPAASDEEDDGVKSVGGSKAVRYDAEETPETSEAAPKDEQPEAADTPEDDEIKTVGGSKSVRYD